MITAVFFEKTMASAKNGGSSLDKIFAYARTKSSFEENVVYFKQTYGRDGTMASVKLTNSPSVPCDHGKA